ncbi:RNase P subunit p30 [Acidianus sp. HS-5]|uniref:RNase P subunit p30 n=1 Tax=Acidianus sp. HS-5 TaxID=2886040 RepID=UPI001F26D42A|nr:RNase P subunit p30 [Acidianus sp. HS-5]BDC19310.1 RNase P p30-like protein [Acidianus sp. HS-5]
MPIEPCILNYKVKHFLKRAGYDNAFIEGKPVDNADISRVTIISRDKDSLFNNIKLYKKSKLIFCKPMTEEILRICITYNKVNAITVDNTNFRLFRRKATLNLIRFHDKVVEVVLPHSSSYVIYKFVIWGYRWIRNILFSSCAKDFNEIWNPLSKINYLILHGADYEMATYWIFKSPQVLLNNVRSNYN